MHICLVSLNRIIILHDFKRKMQDHSAVLFYSGRCMYMLYTTGFFTTQKPEVISEKLILGHFSIYMKSADIWFLPYDINSFRNL
jgi:hypothetical protein